MNVKYFTIIDNVITCKDYPEFKKVFTNHSAALKELMYNRNQLENEVLKGAN